MVKISQVLSVLTLALTANASRKCTTSPEVPPVTSDNVIYGFAYNAKHSSGQCPDQNKVNIDLEFLKKHSPRVRSFGLLDCNQGELILQAAQKTGVDVALGMWLDSTPNTFYAEFGMLKELVQKYRGVFESRVNTIVVGSETLLRHDQNYESLTGRMTEVKNYLKNEAGLPNIKITTGETLEFWENRGMQAAADYIFVNTYSYFDKVPIENAVEHFFSRIQHLRELTSWSGKEIVVSETGWPEGGATLGGSVPSLQSQFKYNKGVACRAKREGLKIYMFSAFDEAWKPNEADSKWGVFKEANVLKPGYNMSC